MTQLVTVTITLAITSKTQSETDTILTRASDRVADAAKYVDGVEVISVRADYVGDETSGVASGGASVRDGGVQ